MGRTKKGRTHARRHVVAMAPAAAAAARAWPAGVSFDWVGWGASGAHRQQRSRAPKIRRSWEPALREGQASQARTWRKSDRSPTRCPPSTITRPVVPQPRLPPSAPKQARAPGPHGRAPRRPTALGSADAPRCQARGACPGWRPAWRSQGCDGARARAAGDNTSEKASRRRGCNGRSDGRTHGRTGRGGGRGRHGCHGASERCRVWGHPWWASHMCKANETQTTKLL